MRTILLLLLFNLSLIPVCAGAGSDFPATGACMEPGDTIDYKIVVVEQIPECPQADIYVESGDTTVYKVVEWMPEFPGGDAELMRYLLRSLPIPAEGKQPEGVISSLLAEFVVEKDGSLSHIRLFRKGNRTDPIPEEEFYGIERAFYESLQASPCWIPGTQRGVPVRVSFFIPLHINLR